MNGKTLMLHIMVDCGDRMCLVLKALESFGLPVKYQSDGTTIDNSYNVFELPHFVFELVLL